jgi:hypothetical protein
LEARPSIITVCKDSRQGESSNCKRLTERGTYRREEAERQAFNKRGVSEESQDNSLVNWGTVDDMETAKLRELRQREFEDVLVQIK